MSKSKRVHKWAFPLGVILVTLALVGAIALVRMGTNGVRRLLDNPEEKLAFEAFLVNIVVHDPDPFDSPDKVQENVAQLLDITLWSLLQRDDARPEDYPMDEDGNLEIRLEDVAAEYKALFGIEPPAYVTVEGSDFDFLYDPEHKLYRVPITAALEIYAPRVTHIKKTGGSIELTVDYLAYDDNAFDERGRPIEPEPTKTMIITLLEQDHPRVPWRVMSIRQPVGVANVDRTTVLG